MVFSPRESGKFISKQATNVKIKEEGIKKLGDVLVEEITSGRLKPSNFSQAEVHPSSEDSHALEWIFVVDTLNFCFWNHENEERWMVEGHSGYFALCAAINRAMKENVDILNPKFYSTITEAQLKKILRSDTKFEIPLITDRVKCLHEVGTVLLENFKGSFANVVKKAENSAQNLLNSVVDNFKCFRDEATYKNKKVSLYKRAQILVGDIWACFKNHGIGYFKDIEQITMFADYRVPQTLLWFDVFEYSQELLDKLKDKNIFKNGDVEEVEIRGCSIHAVELLREYASKKLEKGAINSILIDHFLWDFRRKHAEKIEDKGLPFHKTICIYY